jgi:hypothetical protein
MCFVSLWLPGAKIFICESNLMVIDFIVPQPASKSKNQYVSMLIQNFSEPVLNSGLKFYLCATNFNNCLSFKIKQNASKNEIAATWSQTVCLLSHCDS